MSSDETADAAVTEEQQQQQETADGAAEEEQQQKKKADAAEEKARKKAEASAEKERKKAEAAEEKERKKAKAAEEKEAKRLAAEEKKAAKAKAKGTDKAATTDEAAAEAAETDESVVPISDTTPESTELPAPAAQPEPADEKLPEASIGLDSSSEQQKQEPLPEPEEPPHPDDPRARLDPCPWSACSPYVRICSQCKDYRNVWTERQYRDQAWWKEAVRRTQASRPEIGVAPLVGTADMTASKWIKETTPTGRIYYWHSVTRETRATPPPDSTDTPAEEPMLQTQPYAQQGRYASATLSPDGSEPNGKQETTTAQKPQPEPEPEPEPQPEPQPEPEPEPEPELAPASQPPSELEPAPKLAPELEPPPEPQSQPQPHHVGVLGASQPSTWRERRRRREREAQLLQKEAFRAGSWWTLAGSVRAVDVDDELPAPGSGVVAARRRRRQTVGISGTAASQAQMAEAHTAADERELFKLVRRHGPIGAGEEHNGLLALLQLLVAVRTAARLGVSSSYMDMDYEKGKALFAVELNAVKRELSELSNAADSDEGYPSAVRQFARGSATELLAVRSRLSRSTFGSADPDNSRVASQLCKELADGLVDPSIHQRLLDPLSVRKPLYQDDADVANHDVQDAASSSLDSVWRAQALQLADRVAQLEAEKIESTTRNIRQGVESDSLSDSESDSLSDSDSEAESSAEMNTANISPATAVKNERNAYTEPLPDDTIRRLKEQLETAQKQLKLEQDLRKAAEHALQEAVRARADARTAHRSMAAELQQVEAKQEELQRKLAADDRWLREKDARERAEEKVDELVFLLSRANLEADTAKHELSACKAQMQILEFNQTTSTSAKARADSSLDRCEQDLADAQQKQVESQKRNEELHSALEKIRQENIALDGKLQISVRQVADMDSRLQSVKAELQRVKRDSARERASLDKTNRDALLKGSAREAEFERVVQQQQHYIEDLERQIAGAKLASTVGERERQQLIAANAAIRAELDAG